MPKPLIKSSTTTLCNVFIKISPSNLAVLQIFILQSTSMYNAPQVPQMVDAYIIDPTGLLVSRQHPNDHHSRRIFPPLPPEPPREVAYSHKAPLAIRQRPTNSYIVSDVAVSPLVERVVPRSQDLRFRGTSTAMEDFTRGAETSLPSKETSLRRPSLICLGKRDTLRDCDRRCIRSTPVRQREVYDEPITRPEQYDDIQAHRAISERAEEPLDVYSLGDETSLALECLKTMRLGEAEAREDSCIRQGDLGKRMWCAPVRADTTFQNQRELRDDHLID
jgi:hypothetical protein